MVLPKLIFFYSWNQGNTERYLTLVGIVLSRPSALFIDYDLFLHMRHSYRKIFKKKKKQSVLPLKMLALSVYKFLL